MFLPYNSRRVLMGCQHWSLDLGRHRLSFIDDVSLSLNTLRLPHVNSVTYVTNVWCFSLILFTVIKKGTFHNANYHFINDKSASQSVGSGPSRSFFDFN